jgi:hypothetical protein
MTGRGQHQIPGTIAGGVGSPQAFQDGARRLQDVIDRAWVPGDPRDRRHAKVHRDLGDVPHQDRHHPSLSDVLHLSHPGSKNQN